jgi:hypothetical protein
MLETLAEFNELPDTVILTTLAPWWSSHLAGLRRTARQPP